MYAVIESGGKQQRVEVGEEVNVELIHATEGDEVDLRALLLVDGERVVTGSEALASSKVTARVLGEVKGPKITGFTYKAKTRRRRRYGHRQRYTALEITAIEAPAGAVKGA
ncbi:MAG: 50S ribosomal protein L21 [Acidimicrobiales bacterium]